MSAPGEKHQIDIESFATLAASTLAAQHVFRFRATGNSMHPTIRDGDVVTIVPVGNRRLKPGDIVMHRCDGGGLVLHRIIGTSRRGLGAMIHTRGDAFGAHGETIEEEDVMGRATQAERHLDVVRLDRPQDRMRGLIRALRKGLGQQIRNALRSH